jgi:hypothetical protein
MCNDFGNRIPYDEYLRAFSQIRAPVKFPTAPPNIEPRDDIWPIVEALSRKRTKPESGRVSGSVAGSVFHPTTDPNPLRPAPTGRPSPSHPYSWRAGGCPDEPFEVLRRPGEPNARCSRESRPRRSADIWTAPVSAVAELPSRSSR